MRNNYDDARNPGPPIFFSLFNEHAKCSSSPPKFLYNYVYVYSKTSHTQMEFVERLQNHLCRDCTKRKCQQNLL